MHDTASDSHGRIPEFGVPFATAKIEFQPMGIVTLRFFDRHVNDRRIVAFAVADRTGPGNDVTGLPRFDLNKKNELYFSRLRQRARTAGQSR